MTEPNPPLPPESAPPPESLPARTLKLTIAYDGTDFLGWQFQPRDRTVQGVLQNALHRMTGEPVLTRASGRTDAGVHALGQVVSLVTTNQLPCPVFHRALNAHLPFDIRVLEVCEAAPNFHAIDDAVRKRYRYVLHDGPVPDVFLRRYCWNTSRRLDVPAMQAAANVLLGKHDFAAFQSSGSKRATTVRTVFCLSVTRPENQPDLIHVEVEADGFLYTMVRTIVGVLWQVGCGRGDAGTVRRVLESRDRRQAGPAAPPQGLFLLRVEYGDSPKL